MESMKILKKLSTKLKRVLQPLFNLFSTTDLVFVVEDAGWIIKRIGTHIIDHCSEHLSLSGKILVTAKGLRNKIVHYGSINTAAPFGKVILPHKSNKVVITWFHVREGDNDLVDDLVNNQERIYKIHTACKATKNHLTSRGFDKNKISVIPLGADIYVFKKDIGVSKSELRQKHGIDSNEVIIGSFQKDGNGWCKGMEPKLIKGPDIFVEVITRVHRKKAVHVLLTGPSRGYVENALRKAGVPFTSIGYLKNFDDIAMYYKMLDMYLITSRVEGGPQQILEAWASGVPVVATKTGLIPDISEHEKNALLCDVEDTERLEQETLRCLSDLELANKLRENAYVQVENYDWSIIAKRYYDEIYKPILK